MSDVLELLSILGAGFIALFAIAVGADRRMRRGSESGSENENENENESGNGNGNGNGRT